MKLKALWQEEIPFLLIYTLCSLVAAFILHQLGLTLSDIIYVLLWLCVPVILRFCWQYYKRRHYYKQLYRCLHELDKPYLLYELLPPATFSDARYLNDVIQTMTASFNHRIATMTAEQNDYYDYIQLWVHEIKLSIASLQLMIENHHYDAMSLSRIERQMDQLVQQVLFYAKSNHVAEDYHIQTVSSLDIIRSVIASYAHDFIEASIHLELPEEEMMIHSDKQWLAFILSQILSNAIKYRVPEHPQVMISFKTTEDDRQWIIQDNGIGIAPEDLPHVFEKGYTGKQGRENKKATGMGLYLCHRLCQKLNIQCEIQSDKTGTCVILHFPIVQNTIFHT